MSYLRGGLSIVTLEWPISPWFDIGFARVVPMTKRCSP